MLPVEVSAFMMYSWMIRVSDEPNKFVFAGTMIFTPPALGPDPEDLAALLNDPGAAFLSFESHFGEAIRGRKIIPHIAIGDVWSTTLTLLNTSSKENRIRVNFWSTGGMPLTVSATNETNPSISVTNEMVLTLLPRSSTDFLIAVPPGTNPSTIITGWISVTAPDDAGDPLKPQTDLRPIAGHAIFTNATPGQPIFEAVVPLKDPAGAAVMPFDNTDGKVSCFAVANPVADRAASLSLEFAGPTGVAFSTEQMLLGVRNQMSTCLPDGFPATANRDGVLTIRPQQNASGSNSPAMSVLGFRADISGPFTTTFPVGPADVGGLIPPR